MIPWPVALLTLFYGIIATSSASTLWKILTGVTEQSLAWQMLWLGLSGGAMCGLALMKSWGRALAIWTSTLLMVAMLALAGLLALNAHQPLAGLVVACGAALHMVVIRYLGRPSVRAWFKTDNVTVHSR